MKPQNVKGTSPNNRKPPRTAPAGRKCENCEFPLSIYNRSKLCGPCEKGRNGS